MPLAGGFGFVGGAAQGFLELLGVVENAIHEGPEGCFSPRRVGQGLPTHRDEANHVAPLRAEDDVEPAHVGDAVRGLIVHVGTIKEE